MTRSAKGYAVFGKSICLYIIDVMDYFTASLACLTSVIISLANSTFEGAVKSLWIWQQVKASLPGVRIRTRFIYGSPFVVTDFGTKFRPIFINWSAMKFVSALQTIFIKFSAFPHIRFTTRIISPGSAGIGTIMRFVYSCPSYFINFTAILADFFNRSTLPMGGLFSRFMQVINRHIAFLKGAPCTAIGLLFRQSGPYRAHVKNIFPTYQIA